MSEPRAVPVYVKVASPLGSVVPEPLVELGPVTVKSTGALGMLLPFVSVRRAVTVCVVPTGLVADAGETDSLKFTRVAPGTQFTDGLGTKPTVRLSRKVAGARP